MNSKFHMFRVLFSLASFCHHSDHDSVYQGTEKRSQPGGTVRAGFCIVSASDLEGSWKSRPVQTLM